MKNIIFVIALFLPVLSMGQETSETVLTNSSQVKFEDISNWKTLKFTLEDSTYLDSHSIFYPHAMTVNKQLDIAMMAWGSRQVYYFQSGKLNNIIKINTNRGRGPGEYESPFDMYLGENNMLWVADIDLRKIDIWDLKSKKLKYTYSLNNRFIKPDQIASCSLNNSSDLVLYVLSTQYGNGYNNKEGILHQYDFQNDELILSNTFQEISNDDERYPYVLTGDIICDDEGDLIYSGDFTGTLRKYDRAGNIEFFRTASDVLIEEPLFINLNKGMTRFNPSAPRINGEIFLNDSDLLFVSRSRNRDRDIYGVDVYSVHTGNYMFTFDIPFPAKEIYIQNDKLISIEFNPKEGHDLKIYNIEGLP
ncbi:hypothetical protein ACKGJO_05470 [Gracilimonas sp. Q87]|uniref:hypothetical protein n=1 Tax=Gracilimonas sp. Q87 TaxID=3384766 RepID=UPI00398451D4